MNVTIDDREVKRLLHNMPKEAGRAAEQALDQTAYYIYAEITKELPRIFKNPKPFTLRSLKYKKTRNHNMTASVWFREPDRMEDHYLVPTVEGTERKYKGFERAMGKNKYIPSKFLKLDRYGNVSRGLLRQILGVLGRAERSAGYQANLTAKSAKRNTAQRDYVYLPQGSKGGALPPGIYKRIAQSRRGLNSKAFRSSQANFGTYQRGKRRGKISQIIRARGLRPILLIGKQHKRTKPVLKFYIIAERVYQEKFRRIFTRKFKSLVSK